MSFERLTNKVQNFMWKPGNPKVLFASTRDSIWQYHIDDAIRPADYATLITVQMDKRGSVAFAVGVNDNNETRQVLESKFIQTRPQVYTDNSLTNTTGIVLINDIL